MKSDKFHDFKNGEPWILKGETIHNHICCDCGLVHFVYVERTGKNQFTTYWYRDDYETERLEKRGKSVKKMIPIPEPPTIPKRKQKK